MQTTAQANLWSSPPERSSTFLSFRCVKSANKWLILGMLQPTQQSIFLLPTETCIKIANILHTEKENRRRISIQFIYSISIVLLILSHSKLWLLCSISCMDSSYHAEGLHFYFFFHHIFGKDFWPYKETIPGLKVSVVRLSWRVLVFRKIKSLKPYSRSVKPVFSKQFNEHHISRIDCVTNKLRPKAHVLGGTMAAPLLPFSSTKENPIVNLATIKFSNN